MSNNEFFENLKVVKRNGKKVDFDGAKIALAIKKGFDNIVVPEDVEVESKGNPYAHAILRGGMNAQGANIANYHYEDLMRLHEKYEKMDVVNPAAIIDTNHSNSGKKYKEQIRIAKEILHSRRHSEDLHKLVKGLMIESYIEEGAQSIGEGIYGKSITDPCLGWEDTKRLIYDIAEGC